MIMRVLITGALIAAASSIASADAVTAKVRAWNPVAKTLTLESLEVFPIDTTKVEVPTDLKQGDTVVIDNSSTEDGVTAVFSVNRKS
jgi:CxxC motif-containing protein